MSKNPREDTVREKLKLLISFSREFRADGFEPLAAFKSIRSLWPKRESVR